MKQEHDIEGLIAQVRYRSDASVRRRIRGRLDDRWQRRRPIEVRMMTALARVALAASVLVVIGVLIGLLHRSGGPVYALDQTLDAVKGIRYFHFQLGESPDQLNREAWVEYDPNGSIRNVRVNYYDLNTVAVWSDGISQYWWRDSKDLAIYEDSEYTEKILYFVRRHDPRQAISYLHERGREGGIRVEIDQSDGDADPITVSVTYDPNTYLIGKRTPSMREMYRIDPVTKWITRVEVERLDRDRYVRAGVWEYVDYNRPFDPNTFNLKAEAGTEVKVSDTTGIAMGLEQGGLSDEEVAMQLMREFLDAWAAKNYDEASRIHGYVATGAREGLLKVLGKKSILHVISLGPAVPTEPPLRGLYVPGEVEYEENGHKAVVHLRAHVSRYSESRWCIRTLDVGP